jgi:hypothetical protein
MTTAPSFAERLDVEPTLGAGWFCAQNAVNPPDQHMRVCVSQGGNIQLFESPRFQEHMGTEEGYAVCYNGFGGATVAWDNETTSVGWGAPVLAGAGCNRTVTRVTTDGLLEWKQIFSCDFVEKDLTIKVQLRNIAPFPVFVQGFTRYFDDQIDNTFGSDIADRTGDSVTSRQVNGLSLTGITDFPVTAVHPYPANWAVCNQPSVATPTAPGDWASRVFIPMGFNLAPGQIEAATFIYRRY